MPPRWFCIVVALGWLATTGPLLWKEFRPYFLSRQPPSYTFDLLDQAQGEKHPIRWTVRVGARDPETPTIGHLAESWVRFHPEDDTYTLHTELTASRLRTPPLRFGPMTLRKMTTVERVSQADLQMRAFDLDLLFDLEIFGVKIEQGRAVGQAAIEQGKLRGTVRLSIPGLSEVSWPIPETQTPNNGAVQLPLHLVNRIGGLRPGQTWDVPMVDPVQSLMNYQAGNLQMEVKTVQAAVSAQPVPLPGHEPELKCLVIEYDTDTKPRVFVQVGTDLVLRQESTYQGTRIVIQRMNLQPDR